MSRIAAHERAKYERIWELPQYGDYSPGEQHVAQFLSLGPIRGRLIDLGCGTAKAAPKLASAGFAVELVDFVDARDRTAERFLLHHGCLWQSWARWDPPVPDGWRYQWGYCTDTLEHLPTELVAVAMMRALEHCDQLFCTIAFDPDGFGDLIGQRLHLTVQPFTWWRDLLRELGTLDEARDLLGRGLFVVSP